MSRRERTRPQRHLAPIARQVQYAVRGTAVPESDECLGGALVEHPAVDHGTMHGAMTHGAVTPGEEEMQRRHSSAPGG